MVQCRTPTPKEASLRMLAHGGLTSDWSGGDKILDASRRGLTAPWLGVGCVWLLGKWIGSQMTGQEACR